MKITIRAELPKTSSIVSFLVFLSIMPIAWAQYPERPVQLICAFAAGGGTDLASRILAKGLTDLWKHTVIVENKPGGDGVLAANLIAKGRSDGYIFMITTNAHTITPSLSALPYHPVNDFAPISLIAYTENQILAVHPSVPAKSVAELVALARTKPGSLNFGSSGAGTTPFLAMELLKQMANVDILHIPYKGGSLTSTALMRGEIQTMFGTPAGTYPQVKSGSVRALAITAIKRWSIMPDVPTMIESGFPEFVVPVWYGAMAHVKTSPQVLRTLNADIVKVVKSAEYTERLETQGYDAVTNSPSEFDLMIKKEIERWEKVTKNIKSIAQ